MCSAELNQFMLSGEMNKSYSQITDFVACRLLGAWALGAAMTLLFLFAGQEALSLISGFYAWFWTAAARESLVYTFLRR